jgi:ketosteroid isomerase-like protein
VHLGPRRGVSQVAAFFASIASWKVEEFSVLDVMSSERQVTAQVKAAFVLPNGNRLMDDELHLWTFDGAGKISRLRHYVDTAKHIALSGD